MLQPGWFAAIVALVHGTGGLCDGLKKATWLLAWNHWIFWVENAGPLLFSVGVFTPQTPFYVAKRRKRVPSWLADVTPMVQLAP